MYRTFALVYTEGVCSARSRVQGEVSYLSADLLAMGPPNDPAVAGPLLAERQRPLSEFCQVCGATVRSSTLRRFCRTLATIAARVLTLILPMISLRNARTVFG